MARDPFILFGVPLVILTFVGVFYLPVPTREPVPAPIAVGQSVYYAGCNDVRAAGKAPLHRGQPGYSEHMDGDNDGVACEPHYP
jgi:hypothetical protein